MATRPSLDVSGLPGSTLDHRNSIWWGNTLMITIETMSVALLVSSYFYLKRNFELWPPPMVDRQPPIFEPFPDLTASSVNLALMLLIAVAAWLLERKSRHYLKTAPASPPAREPGAREGSEDEPIVPRAVSRRFALTLFLLAFGGLISSGVRFLEFDGLFFRWNENAYASVTWSLLGIHLLYLLTSVVEFLLLGIWVTREQLTEKFATDLTLATATWYWVAAMWVVIYLVVYWSPRIMA